MAPTRTPPLTSGRIPGRPPGTSLPGVPVGPRRAYRSSNDRWLGGVASGLAHHLGLPVTWVRLGFVAMVAFGGFGAVLYAGLWLFLPAQRHVEPSSPGLDAATRQGKRGGRPQRRLADYGPLVAVGAIAVGILLMVTFVTGQTLSYGPLLLAAARRGGAVVAGRRGPARALARPVEPDGPPAGRRRRRRLARLGPDRHRAAAARRGDHAVLPAVGRPGRGAQRRAGRRLRHRRPRLHGRAVAAAAVLGPERGAGGPGALGGARRRRRPPARLGAPDAGPDPALVRRPGDGLAARPRPGARPALVALRRPARTSPTPSRPR